MGSRNGGRRGLAALGGAAALTLAPAFASPLPEDPAREGAARDLLIALNARLLAAPSASMVLTAWCRERGLLGPHEKLRAVTGGPAGPAPPALRQDLQVGPGVDIARRHVRLMCGRHTVSIADNYYVPARLTPAMNRELATTDHPFGFVVQRLDFSRRRLEVSFLWPARAAAPRAAGAASAAAILRHRAVLIAATGEPISEVVETYQRAVLGLPRP